MTPQEQRNALTQQIRNVVQAAIDDSDSGMYTPEDGAMIEVEYRQAKLDMREFLDQLFPGSHRQDGEDY